MSVILASSDDKKSQLHQQTNVKLEEIENIPQVIQIGEREVNYRDIRLDYYNKYLRTLKRLPSEGQSIKIHTKDSNIQRLLKQQLNDALEIYQIVGQLLDTGEVDINLNHPSTLPAIQVAIAEMNLATNPNDQATANEVCLNIAQRWQQDSRALEKAGLGTRSDVLQARYWAMQCGIQRMRLEKNNLNSSVNSEFQPQLQRPIKLEEIEPIILGKNNMIDLAPIDSKERLRREVEQIINPLIGYYNANIKLLKPVTTKQLLEIRTEDSDLQKLQKQLLPVAVEFNRLQGLRLTAGILTNTIGRGRNTGKAISNSTAEIMLSAIQIALANMNLATNLNERALANEVSLKIAQTWEKNAVLEEKTAFDKRIAVLSARYWRRHCEIQKLRTESK
ncbi:hypothetical protein [Halotia branconii]|uniref:Uncharacterized protein n=1 Tax=Halotia branconii CENA392 TaxID=1539056 RepID=A0AAJ6PCQ0_9CYAN|nr:hypothetical protein [Halotia branconii]WGV29011.1 hypothetical protein QI031_31110 [Halotia branconii CENA392]